MTASAAIEIVITPSGRQYDLLVADLETLRMAGAVSSTQAIVDAVHAAALRSRMVVAPTTQQKRAA